MNHQKLRKIVPGALPSQSSHDQGDLDYPWWPFRYLFTHINGGEEFCPKPGSLTIPGYSHSWLGLKPDSQAKAKEA